MNKKKEIDVANYKLALMRDAKLIKVSSSNINPREIYKTMLGDKAYCISWGLFSFYTPKYC